MEDKRDEEIVNTVSYKRGEETVFHPLDEKGNPVPVPSEPVIYNKRLQVRPLSPKPPKLDVKA